MTTVTATQARQNLFSLVKKSVQGHAPVRILSKNGGVVMISEEDYDGLIETLEILSEPGMLKSIRKAKTDLRKGKSVPMEKVFGK